MTKEIEQYDDFMRLPSPVCHCALIVCCKKIQGMDVGNAHTPTTNVHTPTTHAHTPTTNAMGIKDPSPMNTSYASLVQLKTLHHIHDEYHGSI